MTEERTYELTRKVSVWQRAVAIASSPREAARKAMSGETSDWTYDFDSADDAEFPGELYVSEGPDQPDVPASDYTSSAQGETN